MHEVLNHTQLQQVTSRINLGAALTRFWSLARGPVIKVTALEATDTNGQRLRFVLRYPAHDDVSVHAISLTTEFHLLSHLYHAGLPVPEPYICDLSGEILPFPYMVMAYVEGSSHFDPAPMPAAMEQLAACAARIHSVAPAELKGVTLPPKDQEITRRLADRPATLDAFSQELRIRQILESAWPLPPANPLVLLHGDLWPDNVLWQDGRLAAVIDWEDAALGDPLADLAISRLDIACAYGMDAMQIFTDHYRVLMPGVNFRLRPYWDLYAALRLGPNISLWAYNSAHEQALRTGYQLFLAQAMADFDLLAGPVQTTTGQR